jgi:uncharacterized protein (DUF608 family)
LPLITLACSTALAQQMPPYAPEYLSAAEILEELSDDSDRTLAVKRFDKLWVQTLDERGEPIVYTRKNSADFDYIGMPVGGICAGQLYLGGDGSLWCWDIFNTKTMRDVRGVPTHARPYKRSEPDLRAHHQLNQGFAVRVTEGGRTVTRTLNRDGFPEIEFRGQYPIGSVEYRDPKLPVKISLEAFSPFVPLDLENSAYPATILEYSVTNTSDQGVSGELFGWLENAVCIRSRQTVAGQWRNRVVRRPHMTMVCFNAVEPAATNVEQELREEVLFEDFEADLGDWSVEGDAFTGNPRPNFHHQPLKGFEGNGLADSFHNGGVSGARAENSDRPTGKLVSKKFVISRKAIQFLIGGGDHNKQTCLNLVVDGKIVRTATGDRSETLRSKLFKVAELEGETAHLEIIDMHSGGWGHVLVDQLVFTDNLQRQSQPLPQLLDFGSMAIALLGDPSDVKATARFEAPAGSLTGEDSVSATFSEPSPVGAIGRRFQLRPRETCRMRYVLSWYFPNTPEFPIRTPAGRRYGKRFESAAAVAQHIAKNEVALVSQTRLWRDTWYDSTLPYWFLDRTFLNTSILATNTCYLFSDGRFYGYEGVYHGHGTCNHVWGYVQAPGRLFPIIEQRLREMVEYQPGIGFDEQSGRIAMRSESNQNDAVDGQSSCIFRTYLTHRMQDDDAFLRRVYSSVKKAMNYLTTNYDADRDGVLTGGQHNTLDAEWYGKITWLSLHYTGALRATAAMADEMGDRQYAERCRQLADRGRRYIETKLFNGEYFFHEGDPQNPKSPGVYNGLEYSQLLGQSWAYQVGLGQILDRTKVSTHLNSLWKYNFSTDVGPFREEYKNGRWYAMPGEGGIIACTWPHGGDEALKLGHQHFAGYLNECQPGYEWAATSLMMWHDMPYHALAHTRTMHERYHGAKRNPWNEVEWGSHYSRSMASYGVFIAACGFEYHGPKGYIAFSPRITPESFRAAFTSAAGWGCFTQKRTAGHQIEKLEVKFGKLQLNRLAFDLPVDAKANEVVLDIDGRSLPGPFTQSANRVAIALSEPIVILAGETLTLDIRY